MALDPDTGKLRWYYQHLPGDDWDEDYANMAGNGRAITGMLYWLQWTGDDVWHAHCVKLDGSEIGLFARSRTGVAHCPCSNCRLGSGIAPIRAMRDAGVLSCR